jgi:hypothetical protein
VDVDLRGGLAFLVRGGDINRRNRTGETRRMFSSHGADEYAVVANKIARTLRRKSVKRAAGLACAKMDNRDWSADQRRTDV